MTPTRTILELARGDFLERSRRYSFLLTLGAAACLAYTVHAGWWLVRIGDVAPAPGPARLGMLVGVATGTMLSLVGFYVVRGSVERDRRTGVGPILAAAQATRLQYAAAKFAGNLAVLGAMLAVVALLAVGMVASAGAPSPADAWRAVAPTVLLAGPALALVAGTALLFDSVPALRGAGGNVLYFFLWTAMLGASLSGSPALDVTGIALLHESLREAMTAAGLHEVAGGLTVQARTSGLPETTRFAWSGVDWSAGRVAWRAYWVAAGAAMTGLAAASLRAFDVFGDDASPADAADAEAAEGEGAGDRAALGAGGASRAGPEGRDPAKAQDPAAAALGPRTAADSAEVTVAGSAPPLPARGGVALLRTALGELRLLLSGHRWWWYAGLAAASVAAVLVPAATVGALAWLLPVSAWSSLGCRGRIHGTEQILFSSPGPGIRQMPAQLCAGTALALLTASGPALGMVLHGSPGSLLALGAGALFVPALALCLGVWTGSSRAFEALYVVLWYVGPASGVPPLDFMGVTGRALETGAPAWFLAAAAALASLAWVGRGRRLGAVG